MKNTFQKTERLSGKKKFDLIVKNGTGFFQYPFRVMWMKVSDEMPYPAQVAFAVPKRNFKSAVDRNHIKRICRESYRRNKSAFYDELKKSGDRVNILFIYTHRSTISFQESDAKIILTLQRLIKAIDGTDPNRKKA